VVIVVDRYVRGNTYIIMDFSRAFRGRSIKRVLMGGEPLEMVHQLTHSQGAEYGSA